MVHFKLGAIKLALNFGPLLLSAFDNFGKLLYVDWVQMMCKTTTSTHDIEGLLNIQSAYTFVLDLGR